MIDKYVLEFDAAALSARVGQPIRVYAHVTEQEVRTLIRSLLCQGVSLGMFLEPIGQARTEQYFRQENW